MVSFHRYVDLLQCERKGGEAVSEDATHKKDLVDKKDPKFSYKIKIPERLLWTRWIGLGLVIFLINAILKFWFGKKNEKSPYEMPDIPPWATWITLGIVVLIVVVVFIALSTKDSLNKDTVLLNPSEFETRMAKGTIELSSVSLKVGDKVSEISGLTSDTKNRVRAKIVNDSDVYQRIIAQSETFGKGVEERPSGGTGKTLITFGPYLVLGLLLVVFMLMVRGPGSGISKFKRSRALQKGEFPTTRFPDVGGVDEAKQDLEEIVTFLKDPEELHKIGSRVPQGVLLVGDPGTGKTLLARAVAGEAGVPFFNLSGSEFVELWVGLGAQRVRELFGKAKRNAPCVVFIDEIDAVGRHRGSGVGFSHDEREQTLNQILVEMDGFKTASEEKKTVIVLAATNRPDILDPALLRPGRFDRKVTLTLPDLRGRKAILRIHRKGKLLNKTVSLDTIAQQTPGFSGADLSNLLNEAGILAVRRGRKRIGLQDIDAAIDRLLAGPERKTRIISAKEKNILAYHEAGHALVAWALPSGDQVHKISIVARDTMGGFTLILPETDRYVYLKAYFEDVLAHKLGGRAAEELYCGDISAGACKDLEQATILAEKMVTDFGMSKVLGPRTFAHKQGTVFLGRELVDLSNYGDETKRQIDEEVTALLRSAEARAKNVLAGHEQKMKDLVEALIAHETLQGEALHAFLPMKTHTNGDSL